MKNVFLFLALCFVSSLSFGQGDAPPFTQGQASATKNLSSIIQVPNNLSTKISSSKALIETGNHNLLTNPSFEHSTPSTGWTLSGCTSAAETTIVSHGKKSLKISCAAQTLKIYQDTTLYATYLAGQNAQRSVQVYSTVAGVKVCSGSATVANTSNCVDVTQLNSFFPYAAPEPISTSNGLYIVSSGNITGDIYLDDATIDPSLAINSTDQSRIAGESYFAGTTACAGWTRTSTVLGALATDTDCPGPTIVRSLMGTWAATDSNLPRQTITNLPAGNYKATFYAFGYSAATANMGFAINDGSTTCAAVKGSFSTNGSSVTVSCTFNYTSAGDRVFELYAASESSTVNVPNDNTAPSLGTKFILEYFGSGQTYSSQCGANCIEHFSSKISSTGVISAENSDFINGNCSCSSGAVSCTFNTGVFTVAPNCSVDSYSNRDRFTTLLASTSSTLTYTTVTGTGTGLCDSIATITCDKTGADAVAARTLIGSFKEVMVATGVTKPKTCYYAFGGAAATLASPTECTTGTCVEVYDSCGTGTPPAWSTTSIYQNLTFAAGTFANDSHVKCDCVGFDTTTGQQVECIPYFVTGGDTIKSSSSGGYTTNFYGVDQTGGQKTGYFSVECKGSAP